MARCTSLNPGVQNRCAAVRRDQLNPPAAAEAACCGEAGKCTTFLWVMAMRSRQSELGVEAMLAPEFSQLTAWR